MQIDKRFDECGLANHWISKWKQGKSLKYRGLFDIAAIHEINAKDFGNLTNAERENWFIKRAAKTSRKIR